MERGWFRCDTSNMERALILLAAIALGIWVTIKRVQHRYLPKGIQRIFGKHAQ